MEKHTVLKEMFQSALNKSFEGVKKGLLSFHQN